MLRSGFAQLSIGAYLVALLATLVSSVPQTPVPNHFKEFLDRYIGFSNDDHSELARGKVIVRLLPAEEQREVAVFGVTEIDVSDEFFRRKFRDIVAFKKNYVVPEIGVFSNPPEIKDLAGLTIPEKDLKDARKCTIGKCKIRLSDEAIKRLKDSVDWSSQDWESQVVSVAKEMLVDYVKEYLKGGNEALAEYHDKDNAIPLREDFQAVLDASSYLFEHVPELVQYLRDFPRRHLPGSVNFIYWSKEQFGLKPVISVTHVTMYQRRQYGRRETVISSKQIYASHYFDSSLGITALLEEEDDMGKPLHYLVYLNRSRTLDLTGAFSGLRRSVVEKRLQTGMEKNLGYTKARLEAIYRAETFQPVRILPSPAPGPNRNPLSVAQD
jgi:hypothetical protein